MQQPQRPGQQRQRIIITTTVPQSWTQTGTGQQQQPGPPQGPGQRPKIQPTSNPPPGRAGNPALAISARVALGLVGAAIYAVLALALGFFIGFFYMATIISYNLWGDRLPRGLEERKNMWMNRMMWMGFDGLIACIKFMFSGCNTDILREFFKAVYKPLARVSKQYWDQEFHRS